MFNGINIEDLDREIKAHMIRTYLYLKPEDFIKAHEVYKERIEKLQKAYKDAEIALDSYRKKVEEP